MSEGLAQGGAEADHRRERRRRVALAIEKRKAEIETLWLARVMSTMSRGLEPVELRNAIPDYLRNLVRALRQGDDVALRGGAAWVDVAREHALTRVRQGFDIDGLVHEFMILRQVMVDVAEQEGALRHARDADDLTNLIEAGVAIAVRAYVDSRDYGMRRQEAVHIGFITHEFRNPLGTATLTASRLRKLLPPNALTLMQMLERSLQRLKELVDGVLLTEQFEAGDVTAAPCVFVLGEVVDSCLAATGAEAEHKGLRVVANFDPSLKVHADPALTRSALQNLLDNAIKFTDAGEVRLDVKQDADGVVVNVFDNCHGISKEELTTIFEPFRRGHSSKSGTGLGLAIARRAVEAQGGRVFAESSGDRGCRFGFTMRLA